MSLREQLRWNFTICDMARLTALSVVMTLIRSLDAACAILERLVEDEDAL